MKQKTYKIPNAPEGHPELPVYKTPDGREVVLAVTNETNLVCVTALNGMYTVLILPSSLTPVYLPWPEDGDLVVVLYDECRDGRCAVSAGGKQIYDNCDHKPYAPEPCRIFLPPKGHVLTGENLRREWLEANAKEWEVI